MDTTYATGATKDNTMDVMDGDEDGAGVDGVLMDAYESVA